MTKQLKLTHIMNLPAWNNKGFSLYELNKFDEAIKAYDKRIGLLQDSDVPWTGKGLALDNLNKSDEAIKAFNKVIEIKPQDSIALDGKGVACRGN